MKRGILQRNKGKFILYTSKSDIKQYYTLEQLIVAYEKLFIKKTKGKKI